MYIMFILVVVLSWMWWGIDIFVGDGGVVCGMIVLYWFGCVYVVYEVFCLLVYMGFWCGLGVGINVLVIESVVDEVVWIVGVDLIVFCFKYIEDLWFRMVFSEVGVFCDWKIIL